MKTAMTKRLCCRELEQKEYININ